MRKVKSSGDCELNQTLKSLMNDNYVRHFRKNICHSSYIFMRNPKNETSLEVRTKSTVEFTTKDVLYGGRYFEILPSF